MKISNLKETMFDYVSDENMWFRFTSPEEIKERKAKGEKTRPNELWTVKKAILVVCGTLVEESDEDKMDVERSLALDNICQRCYREEDSFEVSSDDITIIRANG